MKSGPEPIRIGHTPDMDDAFMFYGLASGSVPANGFQIEHVIEDIEALNRRARNGELEMTAISAAAYPSVESQYWIVSVGSSVGQDYGPLLVAKEPREPGSLAGRRVAIPGCHTTAALLLRLAIPDVVPVELPFQQVPQAVLEGKVEAGVVIHEWQLTYRDAGLLPLLDLGVWWHQQTRLPLPLGLNAVKRSLGEAVARQLTTLLRDSIVYGFSHQEPALAHAMWYGRGIDPARARQFIGMYVNEETLCLSPAGREALRLLFERAHAARLIPHLPDLTLIEPL